MAAKIYSPAKNPLQSGRGKLGLWFLEFEAKGNKSIDPLMGWTSSSDTSSQLSLQFESKEAAIEYAEKNGIEYYVKSPKEQKRVIRSYSDNFSFYRLEPWSH